MKLILIISAMAIASVAGQACVENASIRDGKCQCNFPYLGSGELCCYHPGTDKACEVQGDPVIRSFHGKMLGHDFLCGTHIASANSPSSCMLNIFGGNDAVFDGVFFMTKVMVALMRGTASYKMVFTPTGFYQPIVNGFPRSYVSITTDRTGFYEQSVNSIIEVWKNIELGTIHVHACESEVVFRFPLGVSARQARKPGLCIKSSKNSYFGQPRMTLCGTSEDVTNKDLYMDIATGPLVKYMYNTGDLKMATATNKAFECSTYQNIMTRDCSTAVRITAIKKCAFLLYQPVVRRCLFAASSPLENFSRRVFSAFQLCLKNYCLGTTTLCADMKQDPKIKACAPSLLKCETWPVYRLKNSQIVGEGGNTNTNLAGVNTEEENVGDNNIPQWDDSILGQEPDQNTGNGGGVNTDFNMGDLGF